LAERNPWVCPFEEPSGTGLYAPVSSPERPTLLALAWTSEFLRRVSSTPLVECSRLGLRVGEWLRSRTLRGFQRPGRVVAVRRHALLSGPWPASRAWPTPSVRKVPVTILVPAACPRKGRLLVESLFGLSFGLLSHEVSFPYDVSQMWAATCTGFTSPG